MENIHTKPFSNWVGERQIKALGTNAGASVLPFQNWQRFKEAYAPEFVAQAVSMANGPVHHCLDPFGGSGTTALACQFLGIESTTIEVNPYLADLIEAKLCDYDVAELAKDVGEVVQKVTDVTVDPRELITSGPPTLIEPGEKDRWIFDFQVAERICALLEAISEVGDANNRRLLRVLLGGRLIELSNVRVSGKGRRYRGGWRDRKIDPNNVIESFIDVVSSAVHDITLHRTRLVRTYTVHRGDSRLLTADASPIDLAVFSPPYPNSFDYTDVYNVELWMLGYLKERDDNTKLRRATLCSHVQLSREYAPPPDGSPTLLATLSKLKRRKKQLWHRDIPAMVGGYFEDLYGLLGEIRSKLRGSGQVHMVVGDSQYAGVTIPVAKVLEELSKHCGFKVVEAERFRSMRSSAQQGGSKALPETRLVLV